MLEDLDLRALSELHGPQRTVVSVYTTQERGLDTLEPRVRRIREILEDRPAELHHFEESLRLVEDWLDQNPMSMAARCAFGCSAKGFVSGYELPVGVTPELWFGRAPYLRPLVYLKDEYETFVLVLASNEATRIWVVSATRIEDRERVGGHVKNSVKKGGWSQQRYARRRAKQLHRYADEVSERLGKIVEEHGVRRIVLLGSIEARGAVQDALSQALLDRVVAVDDADLHETERALLDQATEMESKQEREEERLLWEEVEEQVLGGGRLATTGATDTLQALQIGRADTLLVDKEARLEGTGCRDCENVVHGTPTTCQICGSSKVYRVRLVDELIRLAQLTGAEVEFCRDIGELKKAGGVAALLRY